LRYRVELTPAAKHDIGNAYAWLKEHTPGYADRWLVGLHEAIGTLAEMPQRCPLAPEAAEMNKEVRQLLFQSWRIVFRVYERRVGIAHVRHSAFPADLSIEE
jgi:plasmid stabilization system protein ParE